MGEALCLSTGLLLYYMGTRIFPLLLQSLSNLSLPLSLMHHDKHDPWGFTTPWGMVLHIANPTLPFAVRHGCNVVHVQATCKAFRTYPRKENLGMLQPGPKTLKEEFV